MPLTEINSRLFGHFLIGNGFRVGGGPLAATPSGCTSVLDGGSRDRPRAQGGLC